jgi:hypothetical protein
LCQAAQPVEATVARRVLLYCCTAVLLYCLFLREAVAARHRSAAATPLLDIQPGVTRDMGHLPPPHQPLPPHPAGVPSCADISISHQSSASVISHQSSSSSSSFSLMMLQPAWLPVLP